MFTIKALPEFTAWLNRIPDSVVQGIVAARIKRLERGLYDSNEATGEDDEKKMSISVDDLPEFDAAPYLGSDEAVAAYLTDILEANDSGLLAAALGEIARARGMTEMAKSAGITREALYKALRSDSTPRFDTVSRVCTALGVRLVAQAINSNTQVLKQEQEIIDKAISSKPRVRKIVTSKPKKQIKKSSVSAAAVKRKAS